MAVTKQFAFRDVVDGRRVFRFTNTRTGKQWLANSRWSLFRVKLDK